MICNFAYVLACFNFKAGSAWVISESAWCLAANFLAAKVFVRLASIATWLILPVVIRSSQRLSHACVSINKFLLWNCERLIISVIVYLIIFDYWITVVILELIHAQSPDCLGGMYLLDNNQQFVLSHDNLADRIWRQIIQVSALSAFDGSVLDYHGIHG